MFVDTNYQTMFTVTGISARNDSGVPLQPDVVYLSFDGPVQKWQTNSGPWELSPDRNIEGWATFRSSFPRGSIEPEHPLEIADFRGIPVPSAPLTVKVVLVYGLKEAKADFTLMPPSSLTQAQ